METLDEQIKRMQAEYGFWAQLKEGVIVLSIAIGALYFCLYGIKWILL